MAFTHTKKVEILSFIKARIRFQTSGSGSRRLDLDPTNKVLIRNTAQMSEDSDTGAEAAKRCY
jgi:hypothetical protein